MILIMLLALGVAAGLLSGGRMTNLATLRLRHVWLPLVAFGLQAVFILFIREPGAIPVWSRYFVVVVTSGAALWFLAVNSHLCGSRLLMAGAGLNAIVMLANGGFMPVTPAALASSGHTAFLFMLGDDQFVRRSKDIVLDKEDTHLWFLSDVLGVPAPMPFSSNFSPGDLLIGLGAAWLVRRGMTRTASTGEGALRLSSGGVWRQLKIHGRPGKEPAHGVRSDPQDDWPGADRPTVSGGSSAQSAGGHA
jgi:hypothetical protein